MIVHLRPLSQKTSSSEAEAAPLACGPGAAVVLWLTDGVVVFTGRLALPYRRHSVTGEHPGFHGCDPASAYSARSVFTLEHETRLAGATTSFLGAFAFASGLECSGRSR